MSGTTFSKAGAGDLPQKSVKRRTIIWIGVVIASLVILAGVGGVLAATVFQKDKSSDQTPSSAAESSSGRDNSTLVAQTEALTEASAQPDGTNGLLPTVIQPNGESVPSPSVVVVTIATTDGSTVYSTFTTAAPVISTIETIVGTAIVSATTATITQAPPSISTAPCANTLAFTTYVSWAGVASPINPSQVLWLYDLPDGQACCEQCWGMSPQKCNVWGYFPLGHPIDDKVSCALVYDYPGSQVDNTCPAGRPQVGIVPAGLDFPYDASGNVGGAGPCAGLIYSVI